VFNFETLNNIFSEKTGTRKFNARLTQAHRERERENTLVILESSRATVDTHTHTHK